MDNFMFKKCDLYSDDNRKRFYFEITNTSDVPVMLNEVILFETASLAELGLNEADCSVFRSGRHKNDMPSVFTLGENSDALQDALSGMTETGDKKEAGSGQRRIVSDHLTILGNPEKYLVITYPEGRKQFFETDLYVSENGDFQKLICKVNPNIECKPGETIQTESIELTYTTDIAFTVREFAREKAQLFRARKQKRPSVFCTWYYYGLTVTLEDVRTNLSKMKERKLPFDVFQIDEGWEITLGEWEPNEKFPIPMKELADEIKNAGYRPGIWTSPFVAHETAGIWKLHPEWILRNRKNEPCLFHMNDTVYYVFDITNPATREYFYNLYHKLTFEWGYSYHKLDFTRAAVIYEDGVYFDPHITLVEAYYEAVKAIRDGMGEDSYFLMCGGLYDPIIGLVDAQRTGSDVLSMWSSTINKDGKTAPYTMKQSILRYYMNEWWDNDPDALMVRVNTKMERNLRLTYGLLNEEEVKTSVINQFMGGGLVCSTEPLDRISEDRLANLKRIIPTVPGVVTPMKLMDGSERFPEKIKFETENGKAAFLIRINWSDNEDKKLKFTLTEEMLPKRCELHSKFVVADYYGQIFYKNVEVGDTFTLSTLQPHASTVIKIELMENKPIIVKSTGHFSMGYEGMSMEIGDNIFYFDYQNPFDFPIDYSVLLPTNKIVDIHVKPMEHKKMKLEDIVWKMFKTND